MEFKNYVGVTDVSSASQLKDVVEGAWNAGFSPEQSHWPQVSALVHQDDLKRKNPPKGLKAVFEHAPSDMLVVAHYDCHHRGDLAKQMGRLFNDIAPFHFNRGVQLNTLMPPLTELEKMRASLPDVRVILQMAINLIGQGSLRSVARYLRSAEGLVDDVAIDAFSTAGGPPLEPYEYRPYIDAVRESGIEYGITIEGGLGPNNLADKLPQFAAMIGSKRFNIDAQSQVKTRRAKTSYFAQAAKFFFL